MMKFMGWIFTFLLVAGLGYAACRFGWLDEFIAKLGGGLLG